MIEQSSDFFRFRPEHMNLFLLSYVSRSSVLLKSVFEERRRGPSTYKYNVYYTRVL